MPSKIDLIPDDKSLILFDGVCNFCNDSVNFVIARDPKSKFLFAPLQSEYGEELKNRLPQMLPDSIVLLKKGQLYTKSDAALRISRELTGAWPLLFFVCIIIPKVQRNAIYDFIARRRYKWFGKKETCMIPGPEVLSRFLG